MVRQFFTFLHAIVLALIVPLQTGAAASLDDVQHVIVIYLENRSFDNLFGTFEGADGIANAGAAATQVDSSGTVYDKLPRPRDHDKTPPAADTRFPADLMNKPFEIGPYVPMDKPTGDLIHHFWHEQMQ